MATPCIPLAVRRRRFVASDTARIWGLGVWSAAIVAVLLANMVRPVPGMEYTWPWTGGLLAFPIAAFVVLLRARGKTMGRLLLMIATLASAGLGLGYAAYADGAWAPYAEALATPASVGIFRRAPV